MTSVWSAEDSDGSQEEDDINVSPITVTSSLIYTDNMVVKKTTESIVTDLIEKFVATYENYGNTGIDSYSDEESEVDEEAWQDAYKNMYAQWLRVCDENCAFVSENAFLIDFKDKYEKKMQVLETLVAEKEDRIKEISTEIERI